MFRVCFLECQYKKAYPHIVMPLLAYDARLLGCLTECICVAAENLSDALKYLDGRQYDLVVVDTIFPIKFLNELKHILPKARFLTGGSGFLDTFLKTGIDFAIIGATRGSFSQLVTTLKSGGDFALIPNLFFRRKDMNRVVIDYSGKEAGFDLKKEIFPYKPLLDWKYIGFSRQRKGYRLVSVVAEFGCAYRQRRLNQFFEGLSLEGLKGLALTKAAKARMLGLFQERMEGGCSFCTCPGHFFLPLADTLDILMEQIHFLQQKYQVKSFSICSENPFRFIRQLARRMLDEKVLIKVLGIRSRADWVNRNAALIEEIAGVAIQHGFALSLEQVGFESLIQKDLDVYNKGYDVAENIKAVELIRRLEEAAPRHFMGGGQDHLSVNPWLTLADLEVFIKNADHMDRLFIPKRKMLRLLDRCLPIYQKIKKDGLLIEQEGDLDTYVFKDKAVEDFLVYAKKIRAYLYKKYLSGVKTKKKRKEFGEVLRDELYFELQRLKNAGQG